MVAAIQVEKLRKAYGENVAAEEVTFEVEQGAIFGIIGPNGAGKTTTVECVQGLRRRDGGSVRVLGLDPDRDLTELRRRIGCQLQQSALPDRIRVWEVLDLFGSFVPGGTDRRHELIEQWGLGDKRNSAYSSLSGGQQQRLLVALALVNNPEVVFLDEMTTGLDPAARRVAWELIEQIRERGTTVVLVTHFMDEAERLCDRLAVINGGRVVANNSPQGLINERASQIKVLFTQPNSDVSFLDKVPGVSVVERTGPRVEVTGSGPVLVRVAAALAQHGMEPNDLRVRQPTLEDVFLSITGVEGADLS